MLDCRSPEAFAAHIPGAINVGIGSSFATCAGSVLPPHRGLVLVLDRADDLREVCWQLLRIGYPLPLGWLVGGIFTWRTAGKPIDILPQWTVHDLQRQLRDRTEPLVLDVRQPPAARGSQGRRRRPARCGSAVARRTAFRSSMSS